MPLYRYVKAVPQNRRRVRTKNLSFILMSVGGAILCWVIWPILSFVTLSSDMFSGVITPIDDTPISAEKRGPLSPIALAAGTGEVISTSDQSVDLTNANTWYPAAPQKQSITSRVNTYSLSVPKLKISNATVTIGGDDLGASLVHYGGTGIPGEFGSTVIFGHSTLPQFYSPNNYKSIFSLLPTLDIGDEIDIFYDGVAYKYKVSEMVVVEATDLSVLEQKFDDSYLTLVTCVPPGTYWKRLNVRAKMVVF